MAVLILYVLFLLLISEKAADDGVGAGAHDGLRAFLAARVAMVLVLVVLPPVMELMILELRELITEDAAFETARCATLLLSAASFSFCFCAAVLPSGAASQQLSPPEALTLGLLLLLETELLLLGCRGGLGALALKLLIRAVENFKGGLSVDALAVLDIKLVADDKALHPALLGRTHKALRREDVCARWTMPGTPFFVKEAHERFADAEFHDRRLGIEGGVHAEGAGRGADCLLLGRGVCAQRMLDAVGELSEDIVRDVRRALADEVYADALGADELNDLNDLLDERLGCVAEDRCASSKKKIMRGFSRSPTSGRRSKSSVSIQRRNVPYTVGLWIRRLLERMLI